MLRRGGGGDEDGGARSSLFGVRIHPGGFQEDRAAGLQALRIFVGLEPGQLWKIEHGYLYIVEVGKRLVVERPGNENPVGGDLAESVGEMPQERDETLLDAGELADRPVHRKAMLLFGEASLDDDHELRPGGGGLDEPLIERRQERRFARDHAHVSRELLRIRTERRQQIAAGEECDHAAGGGASLVDDRAAQEQQRLRFDAVESDVRRVRQALDLLTVKFCVRNVVENPVLQCIAKQAHRAVERGKPLLHQFRRLPQADDERDVFRAAAPATLLMPTVEIRSERRLAMDI